MAGRHRKAMPPGLANPPAARAAPTALLLVPVDPRVEQPDCCQIQRAPVVDCPARPNPERLPAQAPAPRHLAVKMAARSDPMMTRRPPGRAIHFAGTAGVVLLFPRLAATMVAAAVALAFPILPATVAAARERVFPSPPPVAAARHPSHPAVERLPVSPRQAATVAAALAFPTLPPAAVAALAPVSPTEPAAAVAALAFPIPPPAVGQRLHPSHPVAHPSPADLAGQRLAASANH